MGYVIKDTKDNTFLTGELKHRGSQAGLCSIWGSRAQAIEYCLKPDALAVMEKEQKHSAFGKLELESF